MAAGNFASSKLFSISILDGIENKNRGRCGAVYTHEGG
jgi:hypothetical protein